MKLNPRRRSGVRVEMLPLIDIVFLLLIFFIYTMLSMAVHKGVPVSLPVSKAATTTKESYLSITACADGSLFIDKDRVAENNLPSMLRGHVQKTGSSGVFIFADGKVTCQALFVVLDAVREVGLKDVSLQARTPEPSSAAPRQERK